MFLGFDIGTTAVKAVLMAADGAVVASASHEHPTSRPRTNWSEQHPDDWITAVKAAVARLHAENAKALASVKAISLSGQMHSPVLLGADHAVLHPALLWNDGRGQEEARELGQRLPDLPTVSGVIPMAGFSAAKLLWLSRHQPEMFSKVAHVLLPKDYVRLWLTGEVASDMSDAAGTQLLDEARRQWWEPAANAVGLDMSKLPCLLEGVDLAGTLRASVASDLGLPSGIPVAAGGGDSSVGAFGIGCAEDGEGLVSLGTGAVFVVVAERYAPKPDTMLHNFAHCVPRRWYQMAGMLNGASAVRWVLDMIGESNVDRAMQAVAARYVAPSTVLFLPYLTGERTPLNNPDARGVFFGLAASTSKTDILQAALEGVAFSLRDARNCLRAAGSDCESPAFIGGGSRNRLWGQIISDITGLRLRTFSGADIAPGVGAAMLAASLTGCSIAQFGRQQKEGEMIIPNLRWADAYSLRYESFRALYAATRPLLGSGVESGEARGHRLQSVALAAPTSILAAR